MSYAAPQEYTADESKIWKILIENDFTAFCKGDWGLIADDFHSDEFFAIQGNHSDNKLDWNLQYACLEDYKRDWLRQSAEFLTKEFKKDPLDVLFETTELKKIEIKGDVALVHKSFDGVFEVIGEEAIQLDWISLFTLKRVENEWKIVSFLGYLPK